MPFNGVGLFTRVYQWVNDAALGFNVDATRTDTDSNDIASGLSNCITRDGQSPAIADIPLGGHKVTGLAVGSAATDAVNFQQTFTAPSFNGGVNFSGGMTGTGNVNLSGGIADLSAETAVLVPTATTGDVSTKAASTAFAAGLAFSAVLPAQAGNAGKFVTTDGLTASWAGVGTLKSSRTSNIPLASADLRSIIDIISGTFTQTFGAASSLGNGWYVWIRNSSTGDITLDPNGGELIDGLTSYIMYPSEIRLVQCDGSSFTSLVLHPFNKIFITTGTFTAPPGYLEFGGEMWSGGNSGGALNGNGGGGGGGCVDFRIPATQMGSSQTITIGAGGVGTSLAVGNSGGNSSIGSIITIYSNTTAYSVGGSVIQNASSPSGAFASGYEAGGNLSQPQATVWGGGSAPFSITASKPSVYGAGYGGGVISGSLYPPGTSVFGGQGGVGSSVGNGSPGTAPGGGGGGAPNTFTSGSGARGEVRIRGLA